MIADRNILGYIGGSDAQRVHGSWETETFKRFWRERITGEKETSFENEHTASGNIMEAKILRAVGVDEKHWNAYFPPRETMAGINTDAFDPANGGTYHEAKNLIWEEHWKWVLGRSISAAYMYQIKHGLVVTGAERGLLHVCMVTREEKKNPFLITDVKSRVYTFEFCRDFFRYEGFRGKNRPVTLRQYEEMLKHLTGCYKSGRQPRDEDRLEILNSFI